MNKNNICELCGDREYTNAYDICLDCNDLVAADAGQVRYGDIH
jgi:hypothetical protein